MTRVEARQDMVDQRSRRHGVPVLAGGCGVVVQGMQPRFDAVDGGGVEALFERGIAQRLLASAAEVERVVMEDAGRAGDAAGQLAKRLVLEGHEVLLCGKLRPHDITRGACLKKTISDQWVATQMVLNTLDYPWY
ncbi:hypothetical protein D3C80_1817460 [compost metagenome]